MDVSAATVAGGLIILSAIGTPPPDQTPEEMQNEIEVRKIVAVSALVVGAIAGAAAIWGFHTTHECRLYQRAARFELHPPAATAR
jgi:hypothetical protein